MKHAIIGLSLLALTATPALARSKHMCNQPIKVVILLNGGMRTVYTYPAGTTEIKLEVTQSEPIGGGGPGTKAESDTTPQQTNLQNFIDIGDSYAYRIKGGNDIQYIPKVLHLPGGGSGGRDDSTKEKP